MRNIKQRGIHWFRANKKLSFILLGGIIGAILIVQLTYSNDKLLPFSKVDGTRLGAVKRSEAIQTLDEKIKQQKIELRFNHDKKVITTFSQSELGLTASTKEQIDSLHYPLWAKLIPGSILLHHMFQDSGEPTYVFNDKTLNSLVTKQFGDDCVVAPQNATLLAKGDSLLVQEAKNGGTCKKGEVIKEIKLLRPAIKSEAILRVDMEIARPAIETKLAEKLQKTIESHTKDGVTLTVNDKKQTVTRSVLYSWMEFGEKDGELTMTLSEQKAADYLKKNVTPLVEKAAEKTYVTTRDFTEVSKKVGKDGTTLNAGETLAHLQAAALKGDEAKATTTVLKSPIEYTRHYTKSSTGISAMIQHYAESHSGIFGVSFTELGGGKHATYNASKSFVTASTYKLFVAYSTLKRVDAGEWKWDDQVTGGRNLSVCFDDMIVKSDNACAEALYNKITPKTVISEMRGLGLTSTKLGGSSQETTAADLALFLTKLENNQLGIKAESRAKLLSAMKGNIYRQGIPAGASGMTADKVGFLWGLLNDAAIVYSPSGTYVLVIMSDGSSWGALAELTRNIEALR